jgi:Fe-S-cluster containining protein
MKNTASFSYTCNQCGLCCRDKVITLSPYDLLRIAHATGVSTAEARRQYTIRRGSILHFDSQGRCVALDETRCTIHQGRPLACRLYPLGLQRNIDGQASFVLLDPASGSRGIYDVNGTIDGFLNGQGVPEYLDAVARYRSLLKPMCERIRSLTDFEVTEPREFWRVVAREALAETNYDPNPLTDALFDPDGLGCESDTLDKTIANHLLVLADLIDEQDNSATLATAAVMLAVSLGYPPSEVRAGIERSSNLLDIIVR